MASTSVSKWGVSIVVALSTGAIALSCGHDFDQFEPVADGSAVGPADGSGALGLVDAAGGTTTPPDTSGGNATADGGVDPPGAGPGGSTTMLACGATTCAIPADTCCVSELANRQTSYDCVTTATCPRPSGGGSTAALKCSGQANCASGTVCCVQESNGNASSECRPACGSGEAQLCDPAASSGGGCPGFMRCSSDNISDWGNLPRTYATCGGRGH
jgi:hypothetical protein